METLPVQPAGAVAPTLPASTVLSGTPTGDDSFAITLGRALESTPNSVQDGSSITSKASPPSPRGKGAASDSSDSSSMAGIFLTCFVTNLTQSAPTIALNSEAAESTVGPQSPAAESTSDSPPNFPSSLKTSAGEASPNTVTLPAPVGMGSVAAPATLSAWTGKGLGLAETAKPEASRSTARERSQVSIQSSGLVSKAGQNQSDDTATAPPVSTPAWFPGLQENSLLSQSVEQQVGGAPSESKQVQASSWWSTQGPGGPEETQTSRSLTGSWPQFDPAQIQTAPLPPSSQDLSVASSPAPSAGQTPRAASVPGSEASDSSTPFSTTDHPERAEFSSLLGKFAGADVQAASNPTLSAGQTEQAAPPSGLEASDFSTPLSATDHPELAEFSSLLGKFAGADVQAAFNPTLPAGQTEQAAPASGPEASDFSTPLSATDHPPLAEFSSVLGKFWGAEINLKVSGNESPQATAPEKSTTGSDPVAAGTLSGVLRMTGLDSVQIPAAPKAGNLVNTPAKGALHSVQVSSSMAAEVAGQKGNGPEAGSAQAPLSSSARGVPSLPLDTNSRPATPATTLPKDAPPEANGIQPSGAVPPDSGESAAHANLSDPSTSGQGKSGQQSGPGSGDNPPGFKTFTPVSANNPAADSTANLLTAQAPSVPASHANTSSPQNPPSSSQPAATLSAWQNYDGGAGKIVRSAWLSDSASGAEMHVELRSGTLGPLEVHAVMHEGSVGAEIHVQGQEAHTLLAAGLPSLERALGERNLRVENITVYQDQVGGGMSGGEKQDQQSGSSPSSQQQILPWDSPPQPSSAAHGSFEDEELANPAAGLSVRA